MSLKEKLAGLIGNALSDVAPIIAGVVVSFDHESNLATIRCTHRTGRGFEFYELPWTQTAARGVFLPDPVVESSLVPGTHVVLGFRGFDWNYPVILCSYDPLHKVSTRQRNKRTISSYTTRTDKSSAGLF